MEWRRSSEKGRFTCAEWLLNTGRNRCLQYWWKRRVTMSKGMVNPDATVERFSPNTPSAISWATSKEKTVVLCAMGQYCPPLSYFVMYTLRIWKRLTPLQKLFLNVKNIKHGNIHLMTESRLRRVFGYANHPRNKSNMIIYHCMHRCRCASRFLFFYFHLTIARKLSGQDGYK